MMLEHVEDLLSEFALGTLPDAERRSVELHLAGCAHCEAELAVTADTLAALSLSVPPVAPSPSVRERLLTSLQKGGRLARFAERLARLIDISVEKARATLDRIDTPADLSDSAVWQPIPLGEGIFFHQPEVGPRLAGATLAFLRLRPGAQFPTHKHLGNEQVFTVQGGYLDQSTGREWGPGEVQEMPAGSSHSFVAVDGPDCICIGVVMGQIEIGGVVY